MALAESSLSGYAADTGQFPLAHIGGSGMPDVSAYTPGKEDYWSLSKCKRAYTDYLFSKRPEITEQQEARRYRHGAQWSADQIRVLNDRKQPVVFFNYIARSLDRTNGILEKFRTEPKAYPRHPRYQQSADLA